MVENNLAFLDGTSTGAHGVWPKYSHFEVQDSIVRVCRSDRDSHTPLSLSVPLCMNGYTHDVLVPLD